MSICDNPGGTTGIAVEPVLELLYRLLVSFSVLKNRPSDIDEAINDLIKSDRIHQTQFLL